MKAEMTITSQDLQQRELSSVSANSTLEQLVGDVDYFTKEVWRRRPAVFRTAGEFTNLITEREMWDDVDCGLLIRPYFVSFNEGVRSALSDITETRHIVGHPVPGYINPSQVRSDFEAGGTFKYNQPEHWKPAFKKLVQNLQPVFQAEIETYVFLSPPDRTAITTHMDGSHVFVIQVAGEKDWTVGYLDDQSLSVSDRYKGPELGPDDALRTTLTPGDVLYMPHGAPHHATARRGNSIHVAVTVEEPTPKQMSDQILGTVFDDEAFQRLEQHHHQMSTNAVVENLLAVVRRRASTAVPAELIAETVATIRTSLPVD